MNFTAAVNHWRTRCVMLAAADKPAKPAFVGAREYIAGRATVPTDKKSREIAEAWSDKARAQAFFSARVAEAHVIERIREISDAFGKGEIELAEARTRLKQLAQMTGNDNGTEKLTNLGSLVRADLIMEQNAAMAAAVGQYNAGMDPDVKERFPCWRYVSSTSVVPRQDHARYVGHVYSKDDPIWHKIFPPSDFGCKCSVEDCDDPAERAPEHVEKPDSGFSFDPANAFQVFDVSSVKDADLRGSIKEAAEIEFGDQFHINPSNNTAVVTPKPYKTYNDFALDSAKMWTTSPSPARILPEVARARLQAGFTVIARDKRTVIMDQTVLDHWTVENNKLQSDVESRLACLNYAIETLKNPVERWDQETQSRYVKVFQKSTGGFEGCMVCVTEDGKCRTYFLPSINQVNKMRSGIKFQKF